MKIVAIRGKNLAHWKANLLLTLPLSLYVRQVYSPLQAVPEPESQPCWMPYAWPCLIVRRV
mgnify:CR=1 FL=1